MYFCRFRYRNVTFSWRLALGRLPTGPWTAHLSTVLSNTRLNAAPEKSSSFLDLLFSNQLYLCRYRRSSQEMMFPSSPYINLHKQTWTHEESPNFLNEDQRSIEQQSHCENDSSWYLSCRCGASYTVPGCAELQCSYFWETLFFKASRLLLLRLSNSERQPMTTAGSTKQISVLKSPTANFPPPFAFTCLPVIWLCVHVLCSQSEPDFLFFSPPSVFQTLFIQLSFAELACSFFLKQCPVKCTVSNFLWRLYDFLRAAGAVDSTFL